MAKTEQLTLFGHKKSEELLEIESKLRKEFTGIKYSADHKELERINIAIRWEALKDQVARLKSDYKTLIWPVEGAINEINRHLKRISDTGIGMLFLLCGQTGSGKSTFLNTLDLFIEDTFTYNIELAPYDYTNDTSVLANKLKQISLRRNQYSIVVMEGREAPGTLKDEQIDIMLAMLNRFFRNEGKRSLFVLPINDGRVAQNICNRAREIGGMTAGANAVFHFSGPKKEKFREIADSMVSALNQNYKSISDVIPLQEINALRDSSVTIGAFLEDCYNRATDIIENIDKTTISTARKKIHLWMVYCSFEDNIRRNYDIMRQLTYGHLQKIQPSRLIEGDSQDAEYWRERQDKLSLIGQILDVRVMYLPMRTLNAVAFAYAPEKKIEKIKQQVEQAVKYGKVQAKESLIKSTALGCYLFNNEGFFFRNVAKRGIKEERGDLFKQIFKAVNEKELNSSLAHAIREIMQEKGRNISVYTEAPLDDDGFVKVDILVEDKTEVFCLEMKWRSTKIHTGNVARETIQRVKQYSEVLPDVKMILGD